MLLDLFDLRGVARGVQGQQQQAAVAIDFAKQRMRGEKAPQIMRAVPSVGERAFAALTEVRDSFLSGSEMAVRTHAGRRCDFAAPVNDRRGKAAILYRIERDAIRIWRAFRDQANMRSSVTASVRRNPQSTSFPAA